MVWRVAKRGRLIAMIAVSITILFLTFGLPVTANGSQNSGQNNPGGYVKYTLDLLNNTLINGNFVNTHNALGPLGIAYDPSNGYIYVTNFFSDTVSVINGKTNTIIANIPVGKEPVINGVTYSGVENSFALSKPVGVAYDPSNGYIYVTDCGSDTVSVINGTTVIATIPVGSCPRGVAYDPSNGYIYVANRGSDTVSVINGTTVIANITVGIDPVGVAYDPSNGYLYVTNAWSGTVSVINGATNTVIANITVGIQPVGVAYDPSNGYIYVTNYGSSTVSVINGTTVIANIPVNIVIANRTFGIRPAGVAYDPSNGYIYVTDSGWDTVSVINGTTVIANITVGIQPVGVAYDPSNGYLYVTNFYSGTVSIISTTPAQAIETYTVTFTESGLPPGTQWSVTFDGLTKSSTSNSITFTGVLAGNYTWNASAMIPVGNGTRYVVQTSSGTISVPNVLSVSLIYVKQYRVTIQPTAGGSTSPSGTFWYNAGSTIKITATPAPGYEFVGWETNSSITFTNSSSATTTAIINSPGTIVALFKAVPSSTQSSTVSVTSSSVSTNSSTSVSTSSSPISSVTTSTTSTSTKPTPSSVTTSTTSTPSVVPTLVVVVAVVVAVSIVALLMIKLRKP